MYLSTRIKDAHENVDWLIMFGSVCQNFPFSMSSLSSICQGQNSWE